MKTWTLGASLSLFIFILVLSIPAGALPPERPEDMNLTAIESRVTALEGMVEALQTQVAALQAALSAEIAARQDSDTVLQGQISAVGDEGIPGLKNYVSVDTATSTVLFSGANVQIVNGMGSTDTLNGLGNLIVGYNEPRGSDNAICSDGEYDNKEDCEYHVEVWAVNHKSGSHNIVGGKGNAYSSYGGLIVGYWNAINNAHASVTGGQGNTASGFESSVTGGGLNTARGPFSSVSGGYRNYASGSESSVSGGEYNTSIGVGSSLSGGSQNTASGDYSSVTGGYNNAANGFRSSVSGGEYNTASGQDSSVSGGFNRSVIGDYDWAAGALFQDQ